MIDANRSVDIQGGTCKPGSGHSRWSMYEVTCKPQSGHTGWSMHDVTCKPGSGHTYRVGHASVSLGTQGGACSIGLAA